MLHLSLFERDGPVWVVVTYGCRYEERLGELGVDYDFGTRVQFANKGLLRVGVGENVIVDVPVDLCCLTKVLFRFVPSENLRIVAVFESIVGEVFNDNRGLLLVDQSPRLHDEVFGIYLILLKHNRLDGAENLGNRFTSQLG